MAATRRRPKVWRTLTSDDDVTLNEWCRRRTFQQIDTDNTSLSHESRYRTSNVSGNKGSLQVQVCLHEQCHGHGLFGSFRTTLAWRCNLQVFSLSSFQCHRRFVKKIVRLLTSHFVCTSHGVPITFTMFLILVTWVLSLDNTLFRQD